MFISFDYDNDNDRPLKSFVREASKMLGSLIISMRPSQWYKNVVVFLPVVFSLNIESLSFWLLASYAFLIFCALSGGEYIINDIVDVAKDRIHPIKSRRPIASRALKIKHALSFALALLAVALYGAYLIGLEFFGISVVFVVFTLAYSFWLKQVTLVDVTMIAINFTIRALAGILVIGVAISPWIILCALFLAFFLAFGKRRHELILLGNDPNKSRSLLKGYTTQMLEHLMSVSAGALIISYSLYTFLTRNLLMMITIPVVIYAIYRYLLLVHSKNMGGAPELVLKDRGMIVSIIIWIILSIAILYLVPSDLLQRLDVI